MPLRTQRARRPLAALAASLVVTALATTACSSDDGDEPEDPAQSLKPATGELQLKNVCPETVVIQTDWEPEAEHGPLYNLLGPGYEVDTNQKRVSGPLVINGMDTGVDVEVRAGGAAIGYQQIPSQMYLDDDITLATVSTDGAMNAAHDRPVTAVMALLDKSPQMIMWDPETHPDWETIADIGETDEKVVYVAGTAYGPLLVQQGLIKESQLDASYDGSPSRFVADPSIAQQGYATAEPYIYEHEVKAWGKPIKYQLLADVGYNIYPQALSVRNDKLQPLSSCLERLVPVMQRASADFAANPDWAIKLIADIVKQYNTGWVYTEETGRFGAQQMEQLDILANGIDGAVGSFDLLRVEDAREVFTPIVTATGAEVPEDLDAKDLATNDFIDASISIK